jgi:hypothetical protein
MNPHATVFVPSACVLEKGLNPCALEFKPKTREKKIDLSKIYTPHRALTVISNVIANGPEYSHLNGPTMVPFSDGSKRIYVSIRDHVAVRSKKMIGQVYWVRSFSVGMCKYHTKEYEIVYRSVVRFRVKQLGNYIYKTKIITIKNEFEHIREVLEDIRRHVVTPTSYMKQRKAIYVKNVIRIQSIYRGTVVRRKNNRGIHNRRMFRRAVYAIEIIQWWSTVVKTRPSIPECPICLADACPEGEREVIKTPCGHVFCKDCIHDHLKYTIGNQGCPMCRAPLNREMILGGNVHSEEEDLGIPQDLPARLMIVHTRSREPRQDPTQVVVQFCNTSNYRLCIHYLWNGESSLQCYGIDPGMRSGRLITYEGTDFVITYLNNGYRLRKRWRISTNDGYDQVISIY